MSTLELENIKHPDNSGNNIELAADGSVGNLNLSGNMGIGTNSPLSSPAGAFSWANPIATIEGSRPTLYLNGSGSLATIRMWPSGTDGSSTTLDDFHINAIATSGSTPGRLTFAAQGGAIGAGLSINSNNIVTTPDQPGFHASNNGTPSGSTFTSGENTILKFDNVNSNVGGGWNTSTYRYTAPITGRYMIYAQARFDGLTSYARVYVSVNGSNSGYWGTGLHAISTQSPPSGGTMFTGSVQGVLPLSAGDYIELKGGSNNSVGTHQGEGSFGAYLLG
jgi:hypothetical protein